MYAKCAALLLAFGASAFSVGLADARVAVLVVNNKCGPLRVVSVNRCTQDGVIATGTTQISLRATFKSGLAHPGARARSAPSATLDDAAGLNYRCQISLQNPRHLALKVTSIYPRNIDRRSYATPGDTTLLPSRA
jgi:hypothetical protein